MNESRLNCVPFIELKSDKGILRFLIDTGANKNYIKPTHVKNARTLSQKSFIQTVNGKFPVDKFINFNPFPKSKVSFNSEFCIFDFHKFFDGLIGYQTLQEIKAVINAKSNKLILPDLVIQMKRKFPFKQIVMLNAHESKMCNFSINKPDSDIFVEATEIQPSVFINEGIYQVKDNVAIFSISNYSDKQVTFPFQENFVYSCDFETSEIGVAEAPAIKRNLFEKLRLNHLNLEERNWLLKIIANNQNCFHLEGDKLTFTSAIKHEIKTKDEIPVHTKSYRYPHCHKQEVKTQINELLIQKIIRPSISPWTSPVWIVPKKPDASGKKKWRMVIDYRKINEKTIDDRYPIPNITDTLDKLGKSNYFTTLDLASGFHQIEIDPKDVPKTAFSVENGLYEFLRMPFGLKNAPSTFQRIMDHVLKDFIGHNCVIYLDDILIFSTSLQEHAETLNKILKTLHQYSLKVQIDKSDFFKKETSYLGHIITTDGVKPNPEKIEAIRKWPLPHSEKELKGFLGTIGYYRKFIKDFAKIVKPLTTPLRKGEKIVHSKDFVETFNKCKEILTSSNILQYPDYSKPFVLMTDASNFAIGAVLSQGPIGRDKPIAFASRTLSKSEENLSTIEKELLAIVWAVKYFRPYLFGNKFTLFTDHQPLTYIFNIKDPSSKLVRWRLSLEEYDYEIFYKKGKQNVVADGLSRIKINLNDVNNSELGSENLSIQNNVNENSDIMTVHSADTDDSHFIKMALNPVNSFANQIVLEVSENQIKSVEKLFGNIIRTTVAKPSFDESEILKIFKDHLDYKKRNCIFCPEKLISIIQRTYREYFARNKNLKIFISQRKVVDVETPEEENEIIEKTHNRAHRGVNENLMHICEKFFFPGMKRKIRKFIQFCTICKTEKYDRKPYKIMISEVTEPKKPLDVVHIDIFISNSDYFISAVDRFSRYGVLIPVKTRAIIDIRKGLIKLFAQFPNIKLIVSDNEPSFKSVEIRGLFESLDTKTYYTPVNKSEVNGIVERFHSTIAEIFRCIKHKHDKMSQKSLWVLAVSLYNNTIHSAHKSKPAAVFYALKNDEVRPLDPDLMIENKEKFYDEICIELEKRKKLAEKLNVGREEEPKLQENEVVFMKRPGIKSKIKPKFEMVKVSEDNKKTFLDDKNRKLHKNNMRRKFSGKF